ncbi:4666_t:CDS:1, partial [Entrophospora sp. SA101]
NSNSNRTCLLYEKFHSNYYECMKRSYAKIDIERSNALKLSAYKNKKMLEASAISHKIIQVTFYLIENNKEFKLGH